MSCTNCTATTSNGLTLCDLCQRKASIAFEFIPVYVRNLARWRPGRAGSRPVPGSRVLYDGTAAREGTGDVISDRVDDALTKLTAWAGLITTPGNYPRPLTLGDALLSGDLLDTVNEIRADDPATPAAWLCAALDQHLPRIATDEYAGHIVKELAQQERRLRALTESYVPGWYAGACRRRISMTELCGTPTYVLPGITWVTCPACGAATPARDHIETVLEEAADWIRRPKAIAEAIVALVDTEQSVPRLYTRIRQWAYDGHLTPVHHTRREHVWSDELERLVVADVETGFARYRMGDVLDLVLARDTPTQREADAS